MWPALNVLFFGGFCSLQIKWSSLNFGDQHLKPFSSVKTFSFSFFVSIFVIVLVTLLFMERFVRTTTVRLIPLRTSHTLSIFSLIRTLSFSQQHLFTNTNINWDCEIFSDVHCQIGGKSSTKTKFVIVPDKDKNVPLTESQMKPN